MRTLAAVTFMLALQQTGCALTPIQLPASDGGLATPDAKVAPGADSGSMPPSPADAAAVNGDSGSSPQGRDLQAADGDLGLTDGDLGSVDGDLGIADGDLGPADNDLGPADVDLGPADGLASGDAAHPGG